MKKASAILLLTLMTAMLYSPVTAWADGPDYTVSTWDELKAAVDDAAGKGDTEVTINLSADISGEQGDGIIESDSPLQTVAGTTYVINGQNKYQIHNVDIAGAGTVVINADITADDQEDDEIMCALRTLDSVSVEVNGDITSTGDTAGAMVIGTSSMKVNGDVSSERYGLYMLGGSAQINGDVLVSRAIEDPYEMDQVTIFGAAAMDLEGRGRELNITVDGNIVVKYTNERSKTEIWSYGVLIEENTPATITVGGNVSVSSVATHKDSFVIGVESYKKSPVTVRGNVSATGNQATGVYAGADAKASVNGSVTGQMHGVHMDSKATVTVGQDVIGGSVAPKYDLDFPIAGAYIELGEYSQEEVMGSLTVGNIIYGGVNKENAKDSPAIYFSCGSQEEPLPTITVWGLEGGAAKTYFYGYSETMPEEMITALKTNINYTMDIGDIVNGTVTLDKNVAKQGETVVITPTPAKGYHVKGVYVKGVEITPVEGVYSFEAAEGGEHLIRAEFEADPGENPSDDSVPPSDTPTVSDPSNTPTGSDPADAQTVTDKTYTPKTGDNSHIGLLICLMIAALAGIGGILFARRK